VKNKFALILIFLLSINLLKANNLQISNISAPSNNQIQFDVQWDNSWNASAPSYNWDAIWLFVKTQVCGVGSSPWQHSDLRNISLDHTVSGTILQIDAVSDGKGIFLRRSTLGGGNIGATTVTLKFTSTFTPANTNYEVFGIEMVNVPSGSFTVGDGSSTISQSTNAFGSNNSTPYTITSENAMIQDQLRNDPAGPAAITAHNAIPAAFPKGFASFYSMKYEISQNQYGAFLNNLEYSQQSSRMGVVPSSTIGTRIFSANDNRNTLEIKSAGVAFSTPAQVGNDLNSNDVFDEATDGGNIACNFLSWEDLKAYLDWAALRPMTELEYEKICRGTNTPVLVEYAWSNTTINQATSASISNSGAANEISTSTADGLAAYNGGSSTVLGPIRVGFAATAATNRSGAGSGFYGIFDLSGNVWEQTWGCGWYNGAVRINTPTFTGVLGNGYIDASGFADAVNWGGVALSEVRGGNWEYTAQRCQTSDRFYLNSTAENNTRVRRTGGRGVR